MCTLPGACPGQTPYCGSSPVCCYHGMAIVALGSMMLRAELPRQRLWVELCTALVVMHSQLELNTELKRSLASILNTE